MQQDHYSFCAMKLDVWWFEKQGASKITVLALLDFKFEITIHSCKRRKQRETVKHSSKNADYAGNKQAFLLICSRVAGCCGA